MTPPDASASGLLNAEQPAADAVGPRRARWPERVEVGRVVKPHGVRGEVAIEAWGELVRHVRSGADLRLGEAVGQLAPRLLTVRGAHDRLIGTIEGCTDRDHAETFRGAVLMIASSTLDVPADDEFFLFELEGCTVRTLDGNPTAAIGTVRGVIEDGGGLLLEIAAEEGETGTKLYLIPFVAAYLETMDLGKGDLVFALPEGLLDTCVSTS